MMLYLVQHGEAYPEDIDPERRLTEKGRSETERIARYLYSIGVKPAKIIHSPKTRAKETAEIIARYLGVETQVDKYLKPLDDPAIWVDRVKKLEEDVMLVGHLPHLARLAASLLGGSEEMIRFRYSGVVALENSGGKWVLKWFITPEVVP